MTHNDGGWNAWVELIEQLERIRKQEILLDMFYEELQVKQEYEEYAKRKVLSS